MLRKITFALFVIAALASALTAVAGVAHAQAALDCNPGDPGCGDGQQNDRV